VLPSLKATLDTPPPPPPPLHEAHVIADEPPPAEARHCPEEPAVVGRLKLYAVVAPPLIMEMLCPDDVEVARFRAPLCVPLTPRVTVSVEGFSKIPAFRSTAWLPFVVEATNSG
jgi:hypothetical protein